jgi:ribonuclease J
VGSSTGKELSKELSKELRIIPIGGLGEFGMNMMALESGDDIILIDAGILFPSDEHHGINAIVPDLAYVLSKKDRVRGLVLTHGHLDHIGGVPFLLEQLEVPVYGTAFTLGLVRKQASEFTLLKPPNLVTIKPGDEISLGCFTIEGVHVTHSTVQCLALAISTPLGYVLHTGDFKIDQTPVDGRVFDFETFADYGKRGVLMLLSDSTNADVPGFSASERTVGSALDHIFSRAGEALFFTCFSSAIHRVQQIIDRAVQDRRKVALVGRSLSTTCDIASNLRLLRIPAGTVVQPRDLEAYPRHNRVTIIAGSQGEHRSSLTRAARGQHNTAKVENGDIVAFSAKMIPGNERSIHRVIDNLYRCGAKVLYGDNCPGLHASGHPCREELKLLLNLLRPRYFVPIHGDFRQLAQHRALATEVLGRDLKESFVIENGCVLQIDDSGARVLADKVPVGRRLIDTGTRSQIDRDGAMRDRRHLSEYGVLVPVVTIDERKGKAVDVEILDRGFDVSASSRAMLNGAEAVIHDAVRESTRAERRDPALMEKKIQGDFRRYLSRKTSRQSRPVIVPVLLEA